jgi:hypothetical protein
MPISKARRVHRPRFARLRRSGAHGNGASKRKYPETFAPFKTFTSGSSCGERARFAAGVRRMSRERQETGIQRIERVARQAERRIRGLRGLRSTSNALCALRLAVAIVGVALAQGGRSSAS